MRHYTSKHNGGCPGPSAKWCAAGRPTGRRSSMKRASAGAPNLKRKRRCSQSLVQFGKVLNGKCNCQIQRLVACGVCPLPDPARHVQLTKLVVNSVAGDNAAHFWCGRSPPLSPPLPPPQLPSPVGSRSPCVHVGRAHAIPQRNLRGDKHSNYAGGGVSCLLFPTAFCGCVVSSVGHAG
jgi:hypothetical protein